jgi:hypothetical protein
VIQPHLPVRLPCYDFVPVTSPTFDGCLLSVGPPASGVTGSHDVTGGVYKPRERIHRTMADARLLALRLHVGELQPTIRTETGFGGLAPPRGLATHCTGHCSVCVALGIKAMLT